MNANAGETEVDGPASAFCLECEDYSCDDMDPSDSAPLKWLCGSCGKDVNVPGQAYQCRAHFTADALRLEPNDINALGGGWSATALNTDRYTTWLSMTGLGTATGITGDIDVSAGVTFTPVGYAFSK